MSLNKIPTFQEVKNWANSKFPTQSALDSHANATDNPHQVTDDQTGAADALSAHASDTSNPHQVTDDQTGAADALSEHAGDADAHHARPTSTDATSQTAGYGSEVTASSTVYGGGSATVSLPSSGNGQTIDGVRIWKESSGNDVESIRVDGEEVLSGSLGDRLSIAIPETSWQAGLLSIDGQTYYDSETLSIHVQPHFVGVSPHSHNL